MRKSDLKTRSARYFIDLFHRATLRDAVEVAAEKEREQLLTGFQDFCRIPVDVESIARRKGIRFGADLSQRDREFARLTPRRKGFILQLHPNQTYLRKRFTIAHEIGHTLFYRNMEHQIGVFDKMEIQAEELICDMFASALLMPTAHILRSLRRISNGTPWGLLAALERISRNFEVSLPALVSSIRKVGGSFTFPCVLLCFRYRQNQFTKEDKQLRVDVCVSLGDLGNTRTWFNRSARGINLHSAENLFIEWRKQLDRSPEPIGGRYALSSEGGIKRATKESLNWIPEKVNFSIMKNGKWRKEVIPILTSSCLYVREGGDENEAYVISIIRNLD